MNRVMNKMKLLLLATACILGQGYAQERQDARPTLQQTLNWMTNFSVHRGLVKTGMVITGTNRVLTTDQCTLTMERRYPQSRSDSEMKYGTTSFSLSRIDPDSVKVVSDRASSETHWVGFETSDASAVLQLSAEMGSGRKVSGYAARGSLAFDSEESARRFANALRHAVDLCGGRPSPF